MRHRKSFNHLGRTSSHRKAMLSNMATSLILHKRITTTVAKAKALRSYVEPLITRSKDDTTHSRRIAFSYLQSKEAVTELFREVAKKVADRPGGYTRIIKLGNRVGDNADMAMMELVDFNETLLAEKTKAKGKTSRRRRGGKKKTTTLEIAATPAAKKAEMPENENVMTEANEEETKAEVKTEKPEGEAKIEKQSVAEVKEEEKKEKPIKKEVDKKIPEAKAEKKPAAENEAKAVDNKEDKKEEDSKE